MIMERSRKTSKGNLGTKLSQRDVQFTVAIRKAEIRNSNETKNMKKSIEQFSKEHQQILKNLKRERTNLVQKWQLGRHHSLLQGAGNPGHSKGNTRIAEKGEESKRAIQNNRLPHIEKKEHDQGSQTTEKRFDLEKNTSSVQKDRKQMRTIFGISLPNFISKKTEGSFIRDRALTDSKAQPRDTVVTPKIESQRTSFSWSMARKLRHSVSYESNLPSIGTLIEQDESCDIPKRLHRNNSVQILNKPTFSRKKSNENDEQWSFFKTSL